MKPMKKNPRAKASNVPDLPSKETVLFGVKHGDEDWQEVVLSTQPERFEEVKAMAARDGWGRFRVATIDLTTPPDFRKAIMGVAFRGPRDPDMVLAELESAIGTGGARSEAPLLVEELFRMVEAGKKPRWGYHPSAAKYYHERVKEAAEKGLVRDPVDALNEILAESNLDYGEVVSSLESAIDSLANAQAAMAWSTPGDRMLDDLGAEEDEVWIEAEFGDWIAVNGDLVLPERPGKEKPGGYELTDQGGRVPTTEEEVQVNFAIENVARDLRISEEVVQAVADQEGYGEQAYVSVSGDVDVWVLRRDIREYSTRERKHGSAAH